MLQNKLKTEEIIILHVYFIHSFQAVQATPQQISYLGIATPSHISQTLDIAR